MELGPHGYIPSQSQRLNTILSENELQVVSGVIMRHFENSDDWKSIENDTFQMAELLAAAEAPHLVFIDDTYIDRQTGKYVADPQLDVSGLHRMTECLHELSIKLKRNFSISPVFHPHAETHICSEEEIMAFLDSMDSDLLKLALDTGHHIYGGGDPITFMESQHENIGYLHFKDVSLEVLHQVKKNSIPFMQSIEMGLFTELGQGDIDFHSFHRVLTDIEYSGFAIYEFDSYPVKDFRLPLKRAQKAYKWMKRNGFA